METGSAKKDGKPLVANMLLIVLKTLLDILRVTLSLLGL